ncbi:MAG: AmmeMemoRadiSam system protein B [Proteobacteria bacterium]|nr:AmmeMemoRadiSam system protein B [Pseudomonadota bacterium]
MAITRTAAVAGQFYSGDADELRRDVNEMLERAGASEDSAPKAIIAPHAGYVYSGPVAASAYARLAPLRDVIKRVILLGPAHRVAVSGLALSSADVFVTPLGSIRLDKEAEADILDLPQVGVIDVAHAQEHSLEVHLPFLQTVLADFSLVPIVVGDASPQQVAEVLARLWDGPETLIVVSSDLSHYLDYDTARERDSRTTQAIEDLRYDALNYDDACGRGPISGLLYLAQQKGLSVKAIDVRNSGDTAGSRDQVVGYGSYVVS